MTKVLSIILLFVVGLLVLQTISANIKPAGPGLGWHNDWWNPETKSLEIHP